MTIPVGTYCALTVSRFSQRRGNIPSLRDSKPYWVCDRVTLCDLPLGHGSVIPAQHVCIQVC
jgi:hypothetical protein